MNGVKEEYSIKVKQTSKGIWYCDGLQVTTMEKKGLAVELENMMTQVERILEKHNEVELADEGDKK